MRLYDAFNCKKKIANLDLCSHEGQVARGLINIKIETNDWCDSTLSTVKLPARRHDSGLEQGSKRMRSPQPEVKRMRSPQPESPQPELADDSLGEDEGEDDFTYED